MLKGAGNQMTVIYISRLSYEIIFCTGNLLSGQCNPASKSPASCNCQDNCQWKLCPTAAASLKSLYWICMAKFGSGGDAGVASVRSCQKLPSHPAETFPGGSKEGHATGQRLG